MLQERKVKLLKEVLKEAGIAQDELQKVAGMCHTTINFKINGKKKFTVDEAIAIRDYIYARTKKKYKIEDLFK